MLLIFILFTSLFIACNRPALKGKAQLPNILLICADDLGWSDIGCYGSEVQTPNLDRLANEGMRFTRFHNTAKCFPSRACLLTGVYAQQCNYHQNPNNPITNAVTIGEVLHTAGYRTLWSGKHHGLENPVYRGFDHYYGLKDGACNYFNPGNQREGEGAPARKDLLYFKDEMNFKEDVKPGNKIIRPWCFDSLIYMPYTPKEQNFYTTDYFTNYALKWLERYKDEEKPFFLYLAYTAPHDPLMAWPEDIAKYAGKYDEGYTKIRNARYQKQKELGLFCKSYRLSEPTHKPWEDLTEKEKADEIRTMEVYAAMIDRMDQNIGRVLTKLEETGKLDNTLILFVSDNGASAVVIQLEDDYGEIGTLTRWTSLGENWANVANTPFRLYKDYSYEGGTNTPLIAWWPGKIEPATISDFPGHFIDFMATFVDITGAEYPKNFNGQKITPMQGQSLLPIFKGKSVKREMPLFWEWSHGRAAYHNSWKIVKHGQDNPWELYNIVNDPTETENMAEKEPEKIKEMEILFQKWEIDMHNSQMVQ